MYERQWHDGPPAETLLDERADVREIVLVCEGRETVWPYNGIELDLGALLDFRVGRHGYVERLQRGECLSGKHIVTVSMHGLRTSTGTGQHPNVPYQPHLEGRVLCQPALLYENRAFTHPHTPMRWRS